MNESTRLKIQASTEKLRLDIAKLDDLKVGEHQVNKSLYNDIYQHFFSLQLDSKETMMNTIAIWAQKYAQDYKNFDTDILGRIKEFNNVFIDSTSSELLEMTKRISSWSYNIKQAHQSLREMSEKFYKLTSKYSGPTHTELHQTLVTKSIDPTLTYENNENDEEFLILFEERQAALCNIVDQMDKEMEEAKSMLEIAITNEKNIAKKLSETIEEHSKAMNEKNMELEELKSTKVMLEQIIDTEKQRNAEIQKRLEKIKQSNEISESESEIPKKPSRFIQSERNLPKFKPQNPQKPVAEADPSRRTSQPFLNIQPVKSKSKTKKLEDQISQSFEFMQIDENNDIVVSENIQQTIPKIEINEIKSQSQNISQNQTETVTKEPLPTKYPIPKMRKQETQPQEHLSSNQEKTDEKSEDMQSLAHTPDSNTHIKGITDETQENSEDIKTKQETEVKPIQIKQYVNKMTNTDEIKAISQNPEINQETKDINLKTKDINHEDNRINDTNETKPNSLIPKLNQDYKDIDAKPKELKHCDDDFIKFNETKPNSIIPKINQDYKEIDAKTKELMHIDDNFNKSNEIKPSSLTRNINDIEINEIGLENEVKTRDVEIMDKSQFEEGFADEIMSSMITSTSPDSPRRQRKLLSLTTRPIATINEAFKKAHTYNFSCYNELIASCEPLRTKTFLNFEMQSVVYDSMPQFRKKLVNETSYYFENKASPVLLNLSKSVGENYVDFSQSARIQSPRKVIEPSFDQPETPRSPRTPASPRSPRRQNTPREYAAYSVEEEIERLRSPRIIYRREVQEITPVQAETERFRAINEKFAEMVEEKTWRKNLGVTTPLTPSTRATQIRRSKVKKVRRYNSVK